MKGCREEPPPPTFHPKTVSLNELNEERAPPYHASHCTQLCCWSSMVACYLVCSLPPYRGAGTHKNQQNVGPVAIKNLII